MKILLDTDIGTDIDDAVCLAYLLAHPDCELLGITTVTGQADLRARLASVVCEAAGRGDVPIYPGLRDPLEIELRQRIAEQAEVLPKWPHRDGFEEGRAIRFLSDSIRAHSGEVTLVAIGPLTNVGALFMQDPGIADHLGGLVLMGGLFGKPPDGHAQVEWNMLGDPHAARVAFGTRLPLHRTVPIDVTHRVHMTVPEFRSAFAGPVFEPIQDMATVWFRYLAGTTFHDPLAAATVFEPALCRYETGEITISTSGDPGSTRLRPAPDGPHQVATDVDPEAFFTHFREVVA
jgi:purine nucleosidase